MIFRVDGSIVQFGGVGVETRFPQPILETLDTGTVLVVVLDPTGRWYMPENVFGLDPTGRAIWRIEQHEFQHGRSPYVAVKPTPEGVTLFNRCGTEVRIDSATGRILDTATLPLEAEPPSHEATRDEAFDESESERDAPDEARAAGG